MTIHNGVDTSHLQKPINHMESIGFGSQGAQTDAFRNKLNAYNANGGIHQFSKSKPTSTIDKLKKFAMSPFMKNKTSI